MIEKDRLLHELDACHERLQLHSQPMTPANVIDVSKLHDDLLTGPLACQEDFKVGLVALWPTIVSLKCCSFVSIELKH